MRRGNGAPNRGGGKQSTSEVMAGVFDIDLDQPEDAISDDDFEDGVSRRQWEGGQALIRRPWEL